MSVNEQEGFVLCSHSSSVSSLGFLGGWLGDGWVGGASFGGYGLEPCGEAPALCWVLALCWVPALCHIAE